MRPAPMPIALPIYLALPLQSAIAEFANVQMVAHDATTLGRMKSCTRTDSIGARFSLVQRRSAPPACCRAAVSRRPGLPTRQHSRPLRFPRAGNLWCAVLRCCQWMIRSGDLAKRRRARARRLHRRGGGECQRAGCTGDRRQRHDLHARFCRYPLASLDQCAAAADAGRQSQADLFPGHGGLRRAYTPEDSYRSVRLGLAQALTAGITTTQNWAPQRAQSSARRRRNGRDARHRHSWPLRLW